MHQGTCTKCVQNISLYDFVMIYYKYIPQSYNVIPQIMYYKTV